ncbi:macro domain-containing protein [Vibrio neonatus]|uniref:macro domain-containing protein n=1 Tax=Vibrio neonatus TaxID=278860 RepID=UPI0021C3CCC9|nr:macro domain-containing protein [Vibrio neonatus]
MVTEISGNIFDSKRDVIVNAVNCVGIMGAGIALEYRLRYPDMFSKYQQFCEDGLLDIGKIWIYGNVGSQRVLNFPTKKHWKFPSKEEYLRKGLEKFVETYKEKHVGSIAFPLLGADKGGLGKERSLSIMQEYLDTLDIDVDIYFYDPMAKDSLCEHVKLVLSFESPLQIKSAVGLRESDLTKVKEALAREEINQLSQLLKVKGIGQKVVEKLYLLKDYELQPKQGEIF